MPDMVQLLVSVRPSTMERVLNLVVGGIPQYAYLLRANNKKVNDVDPQKGRVRHFQTLP